jgi:hypothetical protein
MDKPAILATLDIQDIGRKQTNIKKTNLIKILVIVAIHVKTSIPIFKITTFQFVLTCHYSDIKNMHLRAVECAIVWLRWVYVYQCSLCCLSSPEFVSLETRPEVRSMRSVLCHFQKTFQLYTNG